MNGDLPLRSQGGQPGNGAVCRCSFCISVKEKYGDKYSHRTMDDSKRDVSRHLDEYAESQEIRQIQREREYQQRRQNKAKQERKKQDDWER